MKAAATLLLAAACFFKAESATITVTLTGTTGEIRVGEGPIFEHSSYQKIPPGAAFSLIYTLDDEKGNQSITGTRNGLITSSESFSPGTNAVLQIGTAVWEFGASTRSQITLNTASGSSSEDLLYATQGSNHISAHIAPANGGYWPRNGDWRSSFTATTLDGSTASFSADNDHVSASGKLLPAAITVSGVDLDGQWLRSTGEHTWQLAHASPKGGYIVEDVTRTIRGTRADGSPITPACLQYWQAWPVPAGADAPARAADVFAEAAPPGSTGEENVTAVARFYEALVLPSTFGEGLTTTTDPRLSTRNATLPVASSITRRIGR